MLDIYNYQIVWQYSDQFIDGLSATLVITIISLISSLILGTLLAIASLSTSKILRFVTKSYIEIMRSTPLLVQIYLIYYLLGELPLIDRRLDEWEGGILALSLNAAAFMSEIIRVGILSVSKGQIEAARSLGYNSWQTYRFVILPQAISKVIPPLIGQTSVLVKDSSLVSFIGVFELFGAGLLLLDERLLPNEAFFTVAIGYLFIYAILSVVAVYLQRKLAGSGSSQGNMSYV